MASMQLIFLASRGPAAYVPCSISLACTTQGPVGSSGIACSCSMCTVQHIFVMHVCCRWPPSSLSLWHVVRLHSMYAA
eukprot:scaffold105708_cov17-Tisochrysis_lutea.AAC.1